MLFLLFSILNITFLIAFIYIGYKAIILVRKEIGLWAAIVLVIGLLSSSSSSTNKNNTNSNFKNLSNQQKVLKGLSKMNSIILEDNLLNNVNLMVFYTVEDSTQKAFYNEANSMLTGFTGSRKWNPDRINIHFIDNKHYSYSINGTMDWYFFKSVIYRELKTFKGIAEIK